MRSPLSPRTLLDIELSAYCSRHRYTTDPGPVIDHLQARAGADTDLLAEVAGTWSGYYESPETSVLAMALSALPGATPWVQLGRERRGAPAHGTHGY